MGELTKKDQSLVASQNEAPMGFEDEEDGDLIVPRVKIIQSLSPERKEKIADEGDIINSLTHEKLGGKTFIPVFKFNNNIWWRDRNDGGGIQCIARDGKTGVSSDGTSLNCAQCRKNEFDNSKQGRDALPVCTKYINFFGFFAGEPLPIILSFAKTNFKEGKKLYSLAKVTMQNMWHNGYTLESKEMSKNGNDWYIIDVKPTGTVSEEDKQYGLQLFKQFRNMEGLNYDMSEDGGTSSNNAVATDEELENSEF